MKRIGFVFCGLLSTILYAQSDGLYNTFANSQKGVQVTTVDSQVVMLNPQSKIRILRSFVFSLNNENSSFYVELIADKMPEKSWPVLCVHNKYYKCTGKGSSDGVYSASFQANRAQAEEIAGVLDVPCKYREHFGHVLDYRFQPLKDNYHTGDSVYVKFTISNTGTVPVYFNKGGMYRNSNGRCNYFSFEVYLNGQLLPDEGPEYDFGGLEAHPELKPGESDSLVECITKWSPFRQPGTYTIKCMYRLHLQSESNTKNYPDNQEDLNKAWDEKAERTIEIVIGE